MRSFRYSVRLWLIRHLHCILHVGTCSFCDGWKRQEAR